MILEKEINRLYHLWDCNDSNRNQWFEFVEPEIIIKKVNYPKGWLHIVGPTGLCVSLINDNKADRLSQQKCDMLDDLLWKIEEIKKENNNEDIRLVNKAGRVIGNESNKGNNGNPIVGEGVGKNHKNQIWKIELLSNGRIQIVDSVHKKCFDDTGKKGIDKLYHLWGCSKHNKNQWFKLELPKLNTSKVHEYKFPTGWMNIKGSNGLCVAAAFEGKGNVRQNICNDSDLLLWRIQDSNGHLTIINKNGKYLDNHGDLSEKGEPVLSFDKKPNGLNQEWKIISLDDGKVLLEDKEHKKCFGDTGKQQGDEIKQEGDEKLYHIWECSDHNHHQIFEFSKPTKNKWVYTPGWFNVIGSTGLCLSAKEDKALLQENCGGGEDMSWKIEERENNLVFVNKLGTVLIIMDQKTTTEIKLSLKIFIMDLINNGLSNLLLMER